MTLKPSSLGNTTQNYIGKSQYGDPNLDGAVDDFIIYSRALSASEITSLFNGTMIQGAASEDADLLQPEQLQEEQPQLEQPEQEQPQPELPPEEPVGQQPADQ
ncbi:hypothetical protein D3C75_1160160 [compost metagenome]